MIKLLLNKWVKMERFKKNHLLKKKPKLLMLINQLQRIKMSHQKISKSIIHKILQSAINKTVNKTKRNTSL